MELPLSGMPPKAVRIVLALLGSGEASAKNGRSCWELLRSHRFRDVLTPALQEEHSNLKSKTENKRERERQRETKKDRAKERGHLAPSALHVLLHCLLPG